MIMGKIYPHHTIFANHSYQAMNRAELNNRRVALRLVILFNSRSVI